MKKIYLLFVFLTVLSSCQKDFFEEPAVAGQTTGTERYDRHGYRISQHEALAQLQTLADALGETRTRATGQAANVQVVTGPGFTLPGGSDGLPGTRSGLRETSTDTLLYVVDRGAGEGFSVLSGVAYLDPVIALTEAGTIDAQRLAAKINDRLAVPLTAESLQANSRPMLPSDANPREEDFILDLLADYVANAHDSVQWGLMQGTIDPGMLLAQSDHTATRNTSVTREYSYWFEKEKVAPLLFTHWNQTEPFNLHCPKINGQLTPAGCYAIAISQVCHYWHFPLDIKIMNDKGQWEWQFVPWWLIQQVRNVNFGDSNCANNPEAREAVAEFVYRVGRWCNMKWTLSGSSCSEHEAASAMVNLGYGGVALRKDYREAMLVEYMRQHRPIPVAAYDNGTGEGHAWVIDGFFNRYRFVYDVYPDGTRKQVGQENQLLIHCNYGWGGNANGYYITGAFNTALGAVDQEDSIDQGCSTTGNYNRWHKNFSQIIYNTNNMN